MKKELNSILEEHEVPEGLEERLLKAAKLQLLVKDMGNLFFKKTIKSSVDIIEAALPKSKKE